jgi:glucose/mannose transport system substrate-binding protein
MSSKKLLFSMITILVLFSMALASCAPAEQPVVEEPVVEEPVEEEPVVEEPVVEEVVEEEVPAGSQLEIYSWWAGDEGPALEALIAEYNTMYPDVEVINATVAGGSGVEAKAVLKTRLLGGDPPDTFQVHAGQELIGTWVVADRMEDLTFLYEEQGWFDKYPQGLIDMMSTEDGIWSVPVNIHRSNIMWYIPANLEAWGVEAPATWDDFLTICPTLQDAGVVPLSVGENWTNAHLFESIALSELGVDGWNALWSGEKAWTDDDVVAAWELYGKILDCTNEDAASLSWQQASDMVINGEAAFNVMGDWANGYFQTTKGLEPNVDYAWVASPGTDGVFMALSDAFGLPKDAPNRENVLNWLRLMGSVEGQDTFNPLKGSIAAHMDTDLSKYSVYGQSAAADWASDTVVGSEAHGAVANETFMSGFADVIELFLNSRDAATVSATAQELCTQSGICGEAQVVEEEPVAALPDLGGQSVAVAVENAYPPFNYIDEATGEGVGWDYDVVTEICSRINCVPDFQQAAWDGIFPAMSAGEYDMLADGVTITEERKEVVDFSIPYVIVGQVLLVRADETATIEEMKANDEVLVGTQLGTTNEIVAKENFPEDRINSFEDFGGATLALLAGDIDAIVIDNVSAFGFMSENEGMMKIAGTITSDEELGFAFPPGSELTAAVDAALEAMKADGTLQELNKKWGLSE